MLVLGGPEVVAFAEVEPRCHFFDDNSFLCAVPSAIVRVSVVVD